MRHALAGRAERTREGVGGRKPDNLKSTVVTGQEQVVAHEVPEVQVGDTTTGKHIEQQRCAWALCNQRALRKRSFGCIDDCATLARNCGQIQQALAGENLTQATILKSPAEFSATSDVSTQ